MGKPDIKITGKFDKSEKESTRLINYSPPLVIDTTDKPKLLGTAEDIVEAAVTALYRLLGMD